jgi:predicted acyl esterase
LCYFSVSAIDSLYSRQWKSARQGCLVVWRRTMTPIRASGIELGQRRLNGPQTTGRDYRNLSQPTHTMTRDDDVPVPMRDGISLLADVHRPEEPGRYPALIAASPYPRQIQDLGAPAGFIEAGASPCYSPKLRF